MSISEGIARRADEIDGILDYAVSAERLKESIRSAADVQYSEDGKVLLSYGVDVTGSVYMVREGTEEIADFAFSMNRNLKHLVLPSSVRIIGEMAFWGCSSLVDVDMDGGVEWIGQRAFAFCTSLQAVCLSDRLFSLGAFAFESCFSLKKIVLPPNLKEMGTNPFSGVSASDVECRSQKFCLEKGILYDCEMSRLISSFNMKTAERICPKSSVQEKPASDVISLPDSVVKIDDMAFRNHMNLKSVHLPDEIVELGSGVFQSCRDLSEIRLGNRTSYLGPGLFLGCRSLRELSIPATVEFCGENLLCCTSQVNVSVPAECPALEMIRENVHPGELDTISVS